MTGERRVIGWVGGPQGGGTGAGGTDPVSNPRSLLGGFIGSGTAAATGLVLTPGAAGGDIWIDAAWTAPATTSATGSITSWTIEALKSGDTLPLIFTPTAAQAPAFRIHGLAPNTLYTISVYAITVYGATSPALTGMATTGYDSTVPATVTGVVGGAGLKSITVTWPQFGTTLAPFQGKFLVDVAQNSSFTVGLVTYDNDNSNVIGINNLNTGTTYYVRVLARSASGVNAADYSSTVSFTPGGALNVDIADLAITGPKIAPQAVTTEKLTVGSVGSNAVMNPGFEDSTDANNERAAQWTYDYETFGSTTWTYDLTGASPKTTGSKSLRMIGLDSSHGTSVASKSFPVAPGDVWYVAAKIRGNAATVSGMYLRAFFGTTENFARGDAGVTVLDIVGNGPFTTTATKYEGQVTVPAGVTWMRVVGYTWLPNVAVDGIFDDFEARKVVVSAVIADGAITTPKIQTGAVTTDTIFTGAITAGKMATNSITAANGAIASLAVVNANINDVSAAKLTAGTIGAYLIQLGTGGVIRSGNYSAGSLGWMIDGAGNAELNNVIIRGVLAAATFASTDFTFYDSGGLHMLRILHSGTNHWLQLGDGINSGSGIYWDSVHTHYVFEAGTAGSLSFPPWQFTGNVQMSATLFADGSIATGGAAYGGGFYANTGAGAIDSNWGVEFNNDGAGSVSTLLKYGSFPGSGLNRRGGVFDSGSNSWMFYADTEMNCYSHTSWSVFSSKDIKKAITPMSVADARAILQLKPVRYKLKTDEDSRPDRFGVVAEDVQTVFPELVSRSTTGDPLGVDYTGLIAPIIAKIIDQENQLTDLKNRVSVLEKR